MIFSYLKHCFIFFKGCVRYIFASLFFKSKRKQLSNQKKCFLFHLKSSFHSRENQILEFQIFRFHNVIKCLSMKQEYILLNNLGSNHSLLMRFGQFMSYSKRNNFIQKFYKNWPENQFQALLCLQRIKHNLHWKMKFSK